MEDRSFKGGPNGRRIEIDDQSEYKEYVDYLAETAVEEYIEGPHGDSGDTFGGVTSVVDTSSPVRKGRSGFDVAKYCDSRNLEYGSPYLKEKSDYNHMNEIGRDMAYHCLVNDVMSRVEEKL